ncbi:MAG: ABC transporter substrate-binding protein [Burkholderiaceae bacterium]|nr:ABC transporter substrate-binding protein [Burkholderiaceae bacterium]
MDITKLVFRARGTTLGVLAAMLLSVPAPSLAQDTIKATVGYYPGAMLSFPAFIAKDKGFFEKNGLDVTLIPVPNGAAMTAALASGSIDFANNSYDNLTTAVSKGLPIRTIAGAAIRAPLSLIVRKGIDLPNKEAGYPAAMADLKGAKLGVIALGVSVHYMTEMLAVGAGLKPEDNTITAVGLPNSARPALKNKSIDAYLSLWPLPAIVEATGEGTILLDLIQDQGPKDLQGLAYQAWWATEKSIKTKPNMITRFVTTAHEAYCWYQKPENLDEVVAILKKNVPVPELNDEQYARMVKTMLPAYNVNIPAGSIETWQKILMDKKVISSPLSVEQLVLPSAMRKFDCPAT